MAASDKVFSGSIPEFYDTHLVPLIFDVYASYVAQRAAEGAPERILETAAGTGAVTRALAPLLGQQARYVVTDLNPPMLEHAAKRQPADDRITWQQADALQLPFENGSFDRVMCQFGAMFFPDRAAGYREALRVLRPGGRYLFSAWDAIEQNDFADLVTKAASAIFADDPPLFLARTPHGYHDVARIESDVRQAGFSAVEITTVTKESIAATARDAAVAYVQGTPLRNEIEARDPHALEMVTERATAAIAKVHGQGPVCGKIQAHVIVARP
jgi:ubiquinone/menaquinone biosynthesis C-methylase UbiE